MNADEANHTARAPTRARTRQLQRALYRAAKASPTRRFHALYDKVCDPDILRSAWEAVRANRGAPGIDGETIQAVEERGVVVFLTDLRRESARDVPSGASAPSRQSQSLRWSPAFGHPSHPRQDRGASRPHGAPADLRSGHHGQTLDHSRFRVEEFAPAQRPFRRRCGMLSASMRNGGEQTHGHR